MTPSACVSVDLDALGCYTAIHGLPAPPPGEDPVLRAGLPRFLDLFAAEGIRATLFVVGQDLRDSAYEALLRRAVEEGHELANHTEQHFYNLRSRGQDVIEEEIARCENRITALTGSSCAGFRTPGYNLSPDIARVLGARGYLYDSSVFPCPPYYLAKGAVMSALQAIGRPSRSQMTLPRHLRAPRGAYRMDPDRPFESAGSAGALWQVPMAVTRRLRLPVIGTTLPMVGVSTRDPAYAHLFNLEFHAIDLVDSSDAGIPPALVRRQRDLRSPWPERRESYREAFARLRRGYTFRPLREALTQ